MYAALLERIHDERRQGLYPHALSARRYDHLLSLLFIQTLTPSRTLPPLVMLTLLHPAKDGQATFRISHQEMIKGIRLGGTGKTLAYHDTLEIPIIENTADEEDLTDGMAEAMRRYPYAPAVLVRRHGVYVWGESECWMRGDGMLILRWVFAGGSWEQAKTQAECLDYLFEIAVSPDS